MACQDSNGSPASHLRSLEPVFLVSGLLPVSESESARPRVQDSCTSVCNEEGNTVLYSYKSIVTAAFMLLVASCMTNIALAGDSDGRNDRIFDAPAGQEMRGLLAAVAGRLPLESRMPIHAFICATLRADLTSGAFASPTTTDPDIDSIAAVTANPAEFQSRHSADPGGTERVSQGRGRQARGHPLVRRLFNRSADVAQWRDIMGRFGGDALCVSKSCRLHSRRTGARR